MKDGPPAERVLALTNIDAPRLGKFKLFDVVDIAEHLLHLLYEPISIFCV